MERIPLYSFIGPEGSGKSTQGGLLAKRLGIPCVSTGDMIRDAAENDPTELGDACRKVFEEHSYLPGPLLLEIVTKRLRREDVARGLVLDGGFRTVEETENFQQILKETGRNFDIRVLFLWVGIGEAKERLLKRKRGDDDNLPGIISRMKFFYKDLDKRMSYIRTNWSLVVIPASGKEEMEVNEEILKLISKVHTRVPQEDPEFRNV